MGKTVDRFREEVRQLSRRMGGSVLRREAQLNRYLEGWWEYSK